MASAKINIGAYNANALTVKTVRIILARFTVHILLRSNGYLKLKKNTYLDNFILNRDKVNPKIEIHCIN